MPILKLKESLFLPRTEHDEQNYISEQHKKTWQHECSNFVKRLMKSKLDKGPDVVQTYITGNMIIFQVARYLTKHEKYLIASSEENAELMREFRLKIDNALAVESPEISEYFHELTGAEVIGHFFDVDTVEDFSIWVVLLDRHLIK